ncbi:MAG: hypothetical protein ABH803_01540 [Candidatus Micrarchaeota archaeon]
MSRISKKSFQKIAEGVLGFLYERHPKPFSTRAIAVELVRDNEFILKVMLFLEKNGYVERKGKKWQLWQLTLKAKAGFDKTV